MANNVDLVMRLLAEDKASGTFKRVGGEVDKSSAKWKKFGGIAAAAVGTAAVLKFGKDSVAAFSEVEDATSALTATYGPTGEALVKFAEDSGDALNLSKREALGAAQSFAMFGKAAGLTGRDLERYTTPLIERAADAASYFGGTTGDAVEAFSAALRGETEPIRKYGVMLDDATMRAKALEMGLVSSTKNALTPQQKALAAQTLILEQTAQAQGDVERTADSMANQIKDAQQKFEDIKVSTGETIAVGLKPLLEVLNSTLGAFNSLPQPVKSTALVVGAVGTAAVIVVPKIAAAKAAVAELGITSATASGRVAKFGKVLGAAGLVLAAGQATSALTDTSRAINRGSDDLSGLLADIAATGKGSETLGYQVGSLGDEFATFNDAIMRSQLPDWADTIDGAIGSVLGFESSAQKATAAVDGVDKALAAMVSEGRIDEAAAAMNVLRDEFVASGGDVEVFDGAIDDYRAALHATLPANKAMAEGVEAVGDEADDAEQQIGDLKSQIDSLIGVQIDAKQRSLAWKDAIASVSAEVEKNGRSLDENTPKGRENANMLLDRVEAALDNAKADLESGKSLDTVRDKYAKNIEQLRDAAIKAGLNRKEVDKLIGSYDKMPDEIKTEIEQEITAAVTISMRSDGSQVIATKNGNRRVYLDTGRANGGSVRAGGAYPVGEFGPELFVPSTSGRIVNATAVRHSSGGGGDLLPVSVNIDGAQVAYALVPVKRNMGGRLPFEN